MRQQLPCAQPHWRRAGENRDYVRRLLTEREQYSLRYSNSRYARLSSSWPVSNDIGDLVLWDDGSVQLRCVIVDDDEAFIKVARAVLERDGVTVAGEASNCAEAVQRARALRPDVVLIDIRLGQESGFDVARRLADNEQTASLIMISTHAGTDYADLIAESPAAGFVPKAQLSGAAIRHVLGTD